MNSGTAWKTAPEPASRLDGAASSSLVKHPTTAWPPAHAPEISPTPTSTSPMHTFRRVARPLRQSPTVPWPYILMSIATLAVLILLVLMQRAQLVKSQYELVDLRMRRNAVLKQRDELKLSIQRLTALERIDAIAHKHLHMARPIRRRVLDMSLYRVSDAPVTARADTTDAEASGETTSLQSEGSVHDANQLTSTMETKDEEGTP